MTGKVEVSRSMNESTLVSLGKRLAHQELDRMSAMKADLPAMPNAIAKRPRLGHLDSRGISPHISAGHPRKIHLASRPFGGHLAERAAHDAYISLEKDVMKLRRAVELSIRREEEVNTMLHEVRTQLQAAHAMMAVLGVPNPTLSWLKTI